MRSFYHGALHGFHIFKIVLFLIVQNRLDANYGLYRFKRLTGRQEAVISERDYKFYSPRHKYRRYSSESSTIHETPVKQKIKKNSGLQKQNTNVNIH